MLGVLQENLITLLAFDDKHSSIIRNAIGVELFGGQYKLLANRIYDYIDRYKKPPKDHIADLLADKLNGEKREAEFYSDVLTALHDAQQNINAEYVMGQLEVFNRRQALRGVAIELAKALQKDTEQSIEEAERLLEKARHQSLNLFDPGLRLDDKSRALDFLDLSNQCFPTGIAELDKRGFGPTRKELWLLIANTKAGKSWSLMHLAKMALVHRLKVVHVTLELSEARTAQRYYQAFFSISKRREKFRITKIGTNELGQITGLDDDELKPAMAFEDENIREKLEAKIDKFGTRYLRNIYVKEFPTGSLTIPQLNAYLDNLEVTERFVPDLLVLDYPDLMKIDKNNPRWALDEIYKDIRGIGVRRNMAVAAVSQTHRGANKAKQVDIDNVAEAYSKIMHADTTITFSQTRAEKDLGLARLTVGAGRNDADNLTVVISQNYGTGNFVVDSAVLKGNYFNLLPTEGDTEDE
ncbi:MAG TPA: DnaB-like helicase C-terminal domain-containing protein [Candidatus Angelobacter sp.]|nr:DnaB-like helicase C-terminal domain-containing protein [Candidatus Angelobacter sp.]